MTLSRVQSSDRVRFAEPWASEFPAEDPYAVSYELRYGNSIIRTYEMIVVDGGRAIMPLPRSNEDRVITREQYSVFCALNDPSTRYFDYINRFRVEE